jgi:hypothetical protein
MDSTHPEGLILGRGAQHVRGLLAHVIDDQVLGIEHQLRRARIEPLDVERDRAADRFVLEVDPQVQLDVGDSKLVDVGVGMVIEARIDRRLGGDHRQTPREHQPPQSRADPGRGH